MDTAVTSVDRTDSRKTRMTMTAMTRPSRPSVVRLSIDRSTNGAWSKTTVSSAPDGVLQVGEPVADLVRDLRPRCRRAPR